MIIGRGGREHAILKKVSMSPLVSEIFIAPGNAGTRKLATNVELDELDSEGLLNFAKANKIDLTIVGPEGSLENGIVDLFRANDLRIFGPSKAATQIESSKVYSKEIMSKYEINTAAYARFTDANKANEYALTIKYPHVIKYDGLAAGKGVVICNNQEEMIKQIDLMLNQKVYGKAAVIIEEFLEGEEFTLLSLVNDEFVAPLEVSRDYKRAYDNDEGLNTGGMGAVCPFLKISEAQKKEAIYILEQTAKAMVSEGRPFTGVLYGGFIATKNGVKVIEYNARFGDPETEVVLQRLKSDLVETIINIMDGKAIKLEQNEETFVGVCLASKGYPQSYESNHIINNIENLEGLYHMGTKEIDNKVYTNGGRVLFVTGSGKNQEEAREIAYNKIKEVDCDNLFYRTDIGG